MKMGRKRDMLGERGFPPPGCSLTPVTRQSLPASVADTAAVSAEFSRDSAGRAVDRARDDARDTILLELQERVAALSQNGSSDGK